MKAAFARRRPGINALTPLVILLAAVPLFSGTAESADLESKGSLSPLIPDGITISTAVTIVEGSAFEYVFFEDEILSELRWEMEPLVLYGAGLGLDWEEGLALSIAGNVGVPGKTGLMYDSDWLNLLTDGSGDLTHLAVGDANLQYAYTAEANAGWRIPFGSPTGTDHRIILTPGIGFRYMVWSWNADDGYIQYAELPDNRSGPSNPYEIWTEAEPKVPYTGTAISYLQEWWMPELTLALDLEMSGRVTAGLSVRGSPLVFCNGEDHHYYGTPGSIWTFDENSWETYFDQLSGGFLIEPKVTAAFRATSKIAFRFTYSRIITSTLRGNTYMQSSNSEAVTVNPESAGAGGGAKLDTANVSMTVILKLR